MNDELTVTIASPWRRSVEGNLWRRISAGVLVVFRRRVDKRFVLALDTDRGKSVSPQSYASEVDAVQAADSLAARLADAQGRRRDLDAAARRGVKFGDLDTGRLSFSVAEDEQQEGDQEEEGPGFTIPFSAGGQPWPPSPPSVSTRGPSERATARG
jgi:hypothetical protein